VGRLLIVSSGGGVGRILWRPEPTCNGASLRRLVAGMRKRLGDEDLELVREVRCDSETGKRITAAVEVIVDDGGRWHDLGSVREQLDELEPPPPERVEFVDTGAELTCTWGGRDFLLELRPGGRWRLSELSTGLFTRSTPSLVRTVRDARVWARLTVGNGWPKVAS